MQSYVAGWPGSNPKDAEFFRRAQTELTAQERSKLVAFGSTRRKKIGPAQDPQVQALLAAETPAICIVAKGHHWQVTEILKAGLEENLEMIRDTVSYLVAAGRTVFVDMEHFFDGYQSDAEYALACCEAATSAGASALVLCDTNGGTMPWMIGDICKQVVDHFDGDNVTVGIHCHNDCGMAVANSCTAVQNGAGMVQGTINGIGERTGNANLCSVVGSMALHAGSKMTCRQNLEDLTSLSHYVDEVLNRTPRSGAPFVGKSAFAHKGGLHVAAMKRSPLSYQHIEPEQVGNQQRVLISELAGRQNILGKIADVGVYMKEASDRATLILNHVKRLESQGYTFEGAEASVHLMILHACKGYCSPFQVLDYSVNSGDVNLDSTSRILKELAGNKIPTDSGIDSDISARATVKVLTKQPPELVDWRDNSEPASLTVLEVSEGSGPLDALAKALMKALLPLHPSLNGVELVDYKVRILDPESATSALTRVMIDFRDTVTDTTWTTVAVDKNIISASFNALIDGLEFALIEFGSSCMLCEDAYYDKF